MAKGHHCMLVMDSTCPGWPHLTTFMLEAQLLPSCKPLSPIREADNRTKEAFRFPMLLSLQVSENAVPKAERVLSHSASEG